MTPKFDRLIPPAGATIEFTSGSAIAPDRPIIPFLRGDGIGPEIWDAAQAVADAAVRRAYAGRRAVAWFEVYAGQAAIARYGANEALPADTLAALRHYRVAVKGPLATAVGAGARSLNVTLRQELDLYANVRPVKYLPGLPSPLKEPEKVDLVIFRENTEDVYAGIEWPAGSPEAAQVIELVNTRLLPQRAPLNAAAAIGIKPITRRASERLVRAAIAYARKNGRRSVTLVHKGNIMKFTEGGFMRWGYDLARAEFGEDTVTEREVREGRSAANKIVIKDRIADAMFQELILRPEEHAVLATTNLNGDYLSDAAAALVGGLGFAAGANLGDEHAVFEAVHGTAPDIAGRNLANPSSLILTLREMLRFLGWPEAADLMFAALRRVLDCGDCTADVAAQRPGVHPLSCSAFAAAIVREIETR